MSASTASRCPQCATLTILDEGLSDLNVVPGTRHHVLLNSNEAPLESDLDFVHSVLSKTGARLAYLDDEISRLRDRLLQLEEKRALLSNYHARNRGVVSPLRRMPPEVMGEIFSWTLLPSTAAAALSCSFDKTASPWVLTHINSRWRVIAIATPSLWSRVLIDYPHPSTLAMVEIQIQRAHELCIYFFGGQHAQEKEIFSFLSQHSSRWETLSVELTSQLVPLLPAIRDRLPSLTKLWIQWQNPESQTGVESIECFRSAPSLVDVGIYNEFRAVPIFLPGHQLTRYDLDGPWEAHWGILTQSPNLIEARIRVVFDDEPWPDGEHMVDLTCLRRLSLSDVTVLDYLRTPVLEEIAIKTRDSSGPEFLDCLESFLERSACVIRRICLAGYIPVSAIAEILRKHHSVLALMVISYDAGAKTAQQISNLNTVISQLTVSPTSPDAAIAPQLNEISVGCQDETSIDHTLYLEMLRSRWENQDCMLKAAVLLTESSRPDISTLSGLEALRRDGLDLLLLEGFDALCVMDSWTYETNAEAWT